MAWKDENTLRAIAQYIRLIVGGLLAFMLVYMFWNDRIDLETVIKALVGLLAVDRMGMAIASRR